MVGRASYIFNNCPKIPVIYRHINAFLTLWHVFYKYGKDLLSGNFKIIFCSYFWIWKPLCFWTCGVAVTRHQRVRSKCYYMFEEDEAQWHVLKASWPFELQNQLFEWEILFFWDVKLSKIFSYSLCSCAFLVSHFFHCFSPFWEITSPIFDLLFSLVGLEVVGPKKCPGS